MYPNISNCLQRRKNNFDFIRLIASVGVIYSHSFPLTKNGEDPFASLSKRHFTLGGLSVTLVLAILSWHLVEKKALGFKRALKRKTDIIPEVPRWLEEGEIYSESGTAA